ncbi:MAG: hypothetical protein Q8Q06_01685 [bacterium]|nr:hypothetical protein [bacterium]
MDKKLYDKNMDNFFKYHLQRTGSGLYSIAPTDDFTKKIMDEVAKIEKGRILTSRIFVIILSLSPFSARIIWDYLRGDYFSVSSMPFGKYLYVSYHLFMSTASIYLMLMAGVIIAGYTITKTIRQVGISS